MNNNEKIYLDKDHLIVYEETVKNRLNKKVDKVEGMGLSHNDLTDELKEKIENAGDSTFSGDFEDLTNKPTKLSDFENDEGFQTEEQVNELINTKVSAVMRYKGEVNDYTDLPSNAEVGDVYNIKNSSEYNEAGDNAVWNGISWDILSGLIDLSNYWSKTELRAITNEELLEIINAD